MIAKNIRNPYSLDNFQELPWFMQVWYGHLCNEFHMMLIKWSNAVLRNRENNRLRNAVKNFNKRKNLIIIDSDEKYYNRFGNGYWEKYFIKNYYIR